MKARVEAGYWSFRAPVGYVFARVPGHGKLLVPNESEASIVREALEGFAAGKLSNQLEVQAFLHKKKFRASKLKGLLHFDQVKHLLTDDLNAGFISFPKWGITQRKGHH